MYQRVDRSPRARRPIRIRRSIAVFAAVATVASLALVATPASAWETPNTRSVAAVIRADLARADRLQALADRADALHSDLVEFCKAIEAGQLELPEGFDPCHSGSGGLPTIPGSGGGSGGGGEVREKGCNVKKPGLKTDGWASDGADEEPDRIHWEGCNGLGCWTVDAKNEDGSIVVTAEFKSNDGTSTVVEFAYDWAETGASTTYVHNRNADGSGTTTRRHVSGNRDDTENVVTVTISRYGPGSDHTNPIQAWTTVRNRYGQLKQRSYTGPRGTAPRQTPSPPRRGTAGIPRVGENGEPPSQGGPTLDEAMKMLGCQLDKQERYVDTLLSRYGGGIDDVPKAEEYENCQRPDENSDEGSSKMQRLPCPGEKTEEGAGPLDPVEGDKGDGDGLHPGRGPDVEDIGPIPVPEALERIPCGGPDVDCAEVAAGALSGILPVAGAVLGWDTGKRLVSRLWPW